MAGCNWFDVAWDIKGNKVLDWEMIEKALGKDFPVNVQLHKSWLDVTLNNVTFTMNNGEIFFHTLPNNYTVSIRAKQIGEPEGIFAIVVIAKYENYKCTDLHRFYLAGGYGYKDSEWVGLTHELFSDYIEWLHDIEEDTYYIDGKPNMVKLEYVND